MNFWHIFQKLYGKGRMPFNKFLKSCHPVDNYTFWRRTLKLKKYGDGSLLFESLRLKDGAIFGVERVKLS